MVNVIHSYYCVYEYVCDNVCTCVYVCGCMYGAYVLCVHIHVSVSVYMYRFCVHGPMIMLKCALLILLQTP